MIQTVVVYPSENGRFAQRVSLVNACNQEERKSTTLWRMKKNKKVTKSRFFRTKTKQSLQWKMMTLTSCFHSELICEIIRAFQLV